MSCCPNCFETYMKFYHDTLMQSLTSRAASEFIGPSIPKGTLIVISDEISNLYIIHFVLDGNPMVSVSDCSMITVVPIGHLYIDHKERKRIVPYRHAILISQKTIVPYANNPVVCGMPKPILNQLNEYENRISNEFETNTKLQKWIAIHQIMHIMEPDEIQFAFDTMMNYLFKKLSSQLYRLEMYSLLNKSPIRPFHIFREQYKEFKQQYDYDDKKKKNCIITPTLGAHAEQIYLYWLSFQPEYEEYIENKSSKTCSMSSYGNQEIKKIV